MTRFAGGNHPVAIFLAVIGGHAKCANPSHSGSTVSFRSVVGAPRFIWPSLEDLFPRPSSFARDPVPPDHRLFVSERRRRAPPLDRRITRFLRTIARRRHLRMPTVPDPSTTPRSFVRTTARCISPESSGSTHDGSPYGSSMNQLINGRNCNGNDHLASLGKGDFARQMLGALSCCKNGYSLHDGTEVVT